MARRPGKPLPGGTSAAAMHYKEFWLRPHPMRIGEWMVYRGSSVLSLEPSLERAKATADILHEPGKGGR